MGEPFKIFCTPIGVYRIEYIGEVLIRLERFDGEIVDFGVGSSFTEEVERQFKEYLDGERRRFDLSIDYSRCTPFQQRVYDEMLRIPYGEVRRYKDIATALGNSKASRAVGLAANRNPLQIVVPCHRVVGSSGSLTGYAGGVSIKEQLLRIESCPLKLF